MYTDKRPVYIDVTGIENGTVFRQILLKQISRENVYSNVEPFVDAASQYSMQAFSEVFKNIFSMMITLLILVGTLSTTPGKIALKVYAPEKVGDVLSFLYVIYWKNATVLIGAVLGIIFLLISTFCSYRKTIKISMAMAVSSGNSYAVRKTRKNMIFFNVFALLLCVWANYLSISSENVLGYISDYGTDIKNYKTSNFISDQTEVYFYPKYQGTDYSKFLSEYDKLGYFIVNVRNETESYNLKCPASLGMNYIKPGWNKYKLKYLPETNTLVSAEYVKTVSYKMYLDD